MGLSLKHGLGGDGMRVKRFYRDSLKRPVGQEGGGDRKSNAPQFSKISHGARDDMRLGAREPSARVNDMQMRFRKAIAKEETNCEKDLGKTNLA